MLGTRQGSDRDEAPPLSARVWLLVPLILTGLVGIVAPWTVPAPRTFATVREERAREERVPYPDSLLPLLRRPDLPAEAHAAIASLHRDLQEEAARHGGTIPRSRDALVRRFLDDYDR